MCNTFLIANRPGLANTSDAIVTSEALDNLGNRYLFFVMSIRPYSPATDLNALSHLYQESILTLGQSFYTPEQLDVWATLGSDRSRLSKNLSLGTTLVSEVDGQLAAFGQLHPIDHIAYLYAHPNYAGKGHARAVLLALESHALAANQHLVHTEASKVARPFFERQGYRVIAPEEVERGGLTFLRYKMEKRLT